MDRRHVGIILLLAIACGGLSVCANGFGFNRDKFAKGEQWEPEIDEQDSPTENDRRGTPSSLRSQSSRKSNEDPIDKVIWSDQARDINRSLGGSL